MNVTKFHFLEIFLSVGSVCLCISTLVAIFKKDLFIFRQKGRKGEKHQCAVAPHLAPTGDLACSPGMCPDWESNQQPFGLQAGAQSTEPHQPGLLVANLCFCLFKKISVWNFAHPGKSSWLIFSEDPVQKAFIHKVEKCHTWTICTEDCSGRRWQKGWELKGIGCLLLDLWHPFALF